MCVYIYIYIAQKFALVSVGFPFSCGNGQEDLQESLNGHIVSFSLKDRAIGGYRQQLQLCHSSPLPLFIGPDSFLLSCHLETLHLFLSSGYHAVAVLNIFNGVCSQILIFKSFPPEILNGLSNQTWNETLEEPIVDGNT